MKAKNVIVASTMAATITIGGTLLGGKSAPASAAASLPAAVQAAAGAAASAATAAAAATPERKKDDFLEALGKSSDEEIDVALYQGKTLADIAEESGRSPQAVIDLQVAELTRQLKERLAGGMLPPDVCEAQIRELPEIVARSVYGR
jgi:DNA-binding NarL/FixJ family response regulator